MWIKSDLFLIQIIHFGAYPTPKNASPHQLDMMDFVDKKQHFQNQHNFQKQPFKRSEAKQ